MIFLDGGWLDSQGRRLRVRLRGSPVSDLSLDVSVQFSADGENWLSSESHLVPIPWELAEWYSKRKRDRDDAPPPAQEPA